MTDTFVSVGDTAAQAVQSIGEDKGFLPPADVWAHWRARLKGEDLGCEDGKPQTGFYRTRSDQPVAIWHDGQTWLATIGTRTVSGHLEVCRIWERCHARPVAYDDYRTVAERGEPWPDQHPAVQEMARDRLPATGLEMIRADVERLVAEAGPLIEGGAAADEDAATRAADLQAKLGELEKRADAERRAEKEPHVEAARAVEARWVPIRDEAARAKSAIKAAVIEPWLRAKADAARKAMAAIGAESDGRAKTRGGRVKLVTRTTVRCSAPAEALRYFANMNDVPPDIIAVVESVARRMIAAGVKDIPGITVTTEQKAA